MNKEVITNENLIRKEYRVKVPNLGLSIIYGKGIKRVEWLYVHLTNLNFVYGLEKEDL